MSKMRVFFLWFGLSITAILCASSFLRAETVSFQSALVWRTDAKGDHVLPDLAPSSTYASEDVIETMGVIQSITLAWQAEGAVGMEASADNGLHYARAVNGVPLKSGFVQGTGLKWRASLGPDAKLSEVRISYKDDSGVTCGFGQPELSGFQFRKSFYVSGLKEGGQFGYQVKMIVGESETAAGCHVHLSSHANPDFSDIRFVLPDEETLLPYYLERIAGEPGSRRGEFFVKVSHIPPEGIDLYVYYGAPQAKSLSDAEAVFDFYDDFKRPLLDTDKWDIRLDLGGSWALAKEGLLLDAAGIFSRSFQFTGGIIEYSATAETGYETRLVIRDADPSSESDVNQVAYASGFRGAEHCIAVGDIVKVNVAKRIAAITRYDYRVVADNENIIFERYSPGFIKKEASASYRDPEGPKSGYLGLKTSGAGRGRSLTTFHWIRARKHIEPEPQVVINPEVKEEAPPALFENINLAENGDLILAAGSNEGAYIMKEFTAPYIVRIIVPNWEGQGVSLDVSSDAGKNYKKDCANNSYLYASKGDFVQGERIKGRVVFKRTKVSLAPRLRSAAIQYALGNIVLLGPNGSEAWHAAEQKDITWTAWDYDRTYPIKIEYSLDGGRHYSQIADKTENDGVYTWRLPNDPGLTTGNALIRISDGYDESAADTSDRVFSITSR